MGRENDPSPRPPTLGLCTLPFEWGLLPEVVGIRVHPESLRNWDRMQVEVLSRRSWGSFRE